MNSTLHAPRVKPAAVRSTVVLFDANARVRSPHFGQGILASRPSFRVPFTVADVAEASLMFAESGRDAEFDRLADEAAFLDRYTRGYREF